eukprot:1203650-Rhodomonas_salina.1
MEGGASAEGRHSRHSWLRIHQCPQPHRHVRASYKMHRQGSPCEYTEENEEGNGDAPELRRRCKARCPPLSGTPAPCPQTLSSQQPKVRQASCRARLEDRRVSITNVFLHSAKFT